MAVLTRKRPDGNRGDEVTPYPIFDDAIDDDDGEINLNRIVCDCER